MLVQSILNTVNTCSSSDSRAGAEFIILILCLIFIYFATLPCLPTQHRKFLLGALLCYYVIIYLALTTLHCS